MRWLLIGLVCLVASVLLTGVAGAAYGVPCVTREYPNPDGSGTMVLQLCDGSYITKPAACQIKQYPQCENDGRVSLVKQWCDGSYSYQTIAGRSCVPPILQGQNPAPEPSLAPAPATPPPPACGAQVKFDSFNSYWWNSTVVARGSVYNPCSYAVDVTIDVFGDAKQGGAHIVDAPTIYVTQLAAGGTTPLYLEIPEGKPVPWFSWTYRWTPAANHNNRWCFSSQECLWIDFWLIGALERLMTTEDGRWLAKVAQEHGVSIIRDDTEIGLNGTYDEDSKTVTISTRLDAYSAAVRATVLAHELQHAADDAAGKAFRPAGQCYLREEEAFRRQAGFWSQFWQYKLPADVDSMHSELNHVAMTVSRDPVSFAATLIRLYSKECNGR